MIESLIIEKLLANNAIQGYTNGNIFISTAPEGTPTPYIIVNADESNSSNDLVIAQFDVIINIYDFNENKRPTREISEEIRQLLNYTLLDGDGYSAIRLFFRGRSLIREPESTLSRVLMTFDARACDDNMINHLINS
jgi:hypothetical protein